MEARVSPHANAAHLIAARDRLLDLRPDASQALRLAALLHDADRCEPGGPVQDLSVAAGEDVAYRRAHADRSAEIAARWLAEAGAAPELCAEVARLVRAHETGGDADQDVLQAADSLSFFETMAPHLASWVTGGRADLGRARGQLDWMHRRIRYAPARARADELHAAAVAELERRASA